MTSSNSNFQNPRKTYKVYILEIIRAKFHQNRFSRLGCSADTHRQTHAHTHAHTHTLGSIATYSVKMTEYKKESGDFSNCPFRYYFRRMYHLYGRTYKSYGKLIGNEKKREYQSRTNNFSKKISITNQQFCYI